MRQQLIDAGVKRLREFGYSTCDSKDILIVPVFREFFRKILVGTIEQAGEESPIAAHCWKLIAEIDYQARSRK